MDQSQNTSTPVQEPNTNPAETPAVSKPIMVFAVIVVVLIAGVLVYSFVLNKDVESTELFSDDPGAADETLPSDSTEEETPVVTTIEENPSYTDYTPELISPENNAKVVLFFTADWCLTCSQLDTDIQNNLSTLPEGLKILKVNYDTDTETKEKYGVDIPHTLIQIDNQGLQQGRWIGILKLSELNTHVR